MPEKRPPAILWICDRSLEHGGVACALYDLYPALKNADSVFAFAAPRNAAFPRLEALGAVVHKVLPVFPQAKGYLWSLKSCFGILRLVTRLKPNIVVADHTNGLWLILFLKAIHFPAKAVYRNHGAGFLEASPRLARFVLRRLDRIITICEPEADTLRRLAARPVAMVPNCLPAHCLSPGRIRRIRENPRSPRIAYVGFLTREKGIFDFIDLIAEIRKDLPSVQGIAIGRIELGDSSASSRDNLLALLREAGIAYLGEIPRESIFREVDVLLVCSRRESFCLTILEAVFSDVFPIAYESPGTRFLLGRVTGCLVENGNIEQMKNSILQAWQCPGQRSEVCEQLRMQFIRQFDPALLATNLVAAFLAET